MRRLTAADRRAIEQRRAEQPPEPPEFVAPVFEEMSDDDVFAEHVRQRRDVDALDVQRYGERRP